MDTLQQFRSMLVLNKHGLDDALETQAEVGDRIGRQLAKANSRMLAAKDELARVEGRASEDIKDADPKLSLPAIAAKVLRHAGRNKAWQAYQDAREEHEEWDSLSKAWQQRSYSIRAGADLYANQYFSLDSVSGKVGRQSEEGGRAALRRASQSRSERAAEIAEQSIREAGATPARVERRRLT